MAYTLTFMTLKGAFSNCESFVNLRLKLQRTAEAVMAAIPLHPVTSQITAGQKDHSRPGLVFSQHPHCWLETWRGQLDVFVEYDNSFTLFLTQTTPLMPSYNNSAVPWLVEFPVCIGDCVQCSPFPRVQRSVIKLVQISVSGSSRVWS